MIFCLPASIYISKWRRRRPTLFFSNFSSCSNISLSLPNSTFASLFLSISQSPSRYRSLLKSRSDLERAIIEAMAGGAFTYVCLLPIDAIKTKLQTKGAAQIDSGALDAAIQTFRSHGILGFYRGISAVLDGSASSSAVYFGTCELGKSLLSKIPAFPPLLIQPTADRRRHGKHRLVRHHGPQGALITQRMQAGAVGRSWEVLRILEKDGILGLYAGYSFTLLRNLPAGILSYSSFEYMKGFMLSRTGKEFLESAQSVLCGTLAGAISASLTRPLDVVKTRLMTQVHGAARKNVADTLKQIVAEEGWGGLARGIGPRVLHSACFSALGYFTFETARLAILRQYARRRHEMVCSSSPCGEILL